MLAKSLRVAHQSGALRTRDLARVTVDTTVQPKNIAFPTDAELLHEAMMAARYAHAKQFNRHPREVRFLRTHLGRLIRDIRRKPSSI